MRAIQRFGKQLQQLRTRRSLTQEQLAVTAGLSRAFLTRLELGQHDPSLSTLVRLAKALKVSVAELLGESVSASRWWQVGEVRFATREDAETHARAAGEMFVAQYQNKPAGPVRRLLPVRGTK
ncbi:MAG TPA: helix-turn-helix transcriptional regulator [Nitrospiraceae bacterium]|nr:helix-turn-helix transcriptional regulator [Nitrospiraceae bacterium]